MKWKPDWHQAKANHVKWWAGDGLVLLLTAPRAKSIEEIPEPAAPDDIAARWTDPAHRCSSAEYLMSRTFYAADAVPYFNTQIGPGSLGTFLGAEPRFTPETVWYEPCIHDPDAYGPIRFEPEGNKWFDVHLAVIEEGLRRAEGRYLVGVPDLIENLDTLAAMRGTEQLLLDLIERPAWVQQRLAEINEAYFAAFELLYQKVRDTDGGQVFATFSVWGPGRTAKVQCDFSAMISPAMFCEFVVPHLAAQCGWLDYSLYHLDGTTALQHLDALLKIDSLNAIEWTPQAGLPGGGDPGWYDLYRRIKAGGKSVQAVGVACEQVIPLIDAVGPEGMFICTGAPDQKKAEELTGKVLKYR
ncbi:MAG: hypothetical protein ACYTF6_11325 [Planctomycetota bacterium]